MASSAPRFADIHAARPTAETLADAFSGISALLDRGDRTSALATWETVRRDYDTWSALVYLRFSQDTTDAQTKADREYADRLSPTAIGHDIALKRRLLADPDRGAIAALAGAHALDLWESDVLTFDPAIAGDLEEESRLGARYMELLASAELTIDGARVNLSGLAPFAEDPDRARRHRAEQARWAFFAANGAELDDIFDQLVRLRHAMGQKLGYETHTGLGYRRMRRTDYGPDDVARYRDEIVTHVVPLVARLLEERRRENGWDTLRFWDEGFVDPRGNPKPAGDHDALVAGAEKMFDRMDPRMGAFYRLMRDGGFLDLRNRPGKAGGGFCTAFPAAGMPFIFANFNGTHHDINVFTHEMGHAFQNFESRHLGADFLWPTSEAAEINSMALEFFAYPFMDFLVEPGTADRFRRMHLINSLAFLPYGACVDHFQHEIYAHPGATPAERHAMWQTLERRYMPWTDYADLAYPAKGGRWQAKHHIYQSPFYYIDYTLALCCAMQFWTRSRTDFPGAFDAYAALCGRGGSAPFQALARSAGLISPFQPGALADVVRTAEAVLAG